MCGIAGIVSWQRDDRAALDGAVARMTASLAHRGPDGEGVARVSSSDEDVTAVFGHRRLSIIDLSDRGAQPMTHDGDWVTFNGEIYNFESLRTALEARGHRFRSQSDTEVILRGYREWGTEVFGRLRGMFALALWDGRTRELVLARDRFGIKPLYVWRDGGRVVFASEIRAALASGFIPRRLDPIALDQYLTYQTVPAPRTLVAGVRMQIPATFERHRASGATSTEYWHLLASPPEAARSATAAEARAAVRDRLIEATRLHLVSDVPVGVFLSGGIDSSAVAALVRACGATPRTFAVTFPGTSYDEAPFARAAADAVGAEHLEIPIGPSDLRDSLPGALEAIDHPTGDGINSFVISRAVRGAGFKVALSGLGGDEIFCGYPSFRRMARSAPFGRLWKHSPREVRSATARAVRSLGGGSVAATKTAALLETDASLPAMFPVLRQLYGREQREALVGAALVARSAEVGDPYFGVLEQASSTHGDLGLMSLVSFAEARTYMHDVLLRDTDQMSMRHALEVRVPLLDHELAEYVMGVGDRVKTAGRVPKPLLVDSLGDVLPRSIVDRPKQGFVLPFDDWMRGDLRGLCERHLGPDGLLRHGLFDAGAVRTLWASFLDRKPNTTWSRLWTLVALNAWLEQTGVEAA